MKKTTKEPDEDDILARLGDRVEKAIATIQELRRERDALRSKLEAAEAKLREAADVSEGYLKERSEIRNRIETILSNLESLETAES